jgi:hypothetical protein
MLIVYLLRRHAEREAVPPVVSKHPYLFRSLSSMDTSLWQGLTSAGSWIQLMRFSSIFSIPLLFFAIYGLMNFVVGLPKDKADNMPDMPM